MIPHIEDVKGEPVVGRFYRVRCVMNSGIWFPVLGPWHDDKEIIGFEQEHFHFDMRFATKRNLQHWRTHRSHVLDDEEFCQRSMARVVVLFTDEAVMVRKCLRAQHDFPMRTLDGNSNYMQAKLEQGYAGKRMTCATCPHRGFRLDQLPQKNGVVVCPGHGLAWNMQTGEMVSRL